MAISAFIGQAPVLPTGRPGEPLPGEDVTLTRSTPVPSSKLPVGTKWGVFRPKQGASGTWHWGVDLPAHWTTAVVAPETMSIMHVWTTNDSPPFSGYGPAGVLAKGKSGVYHLLAHLDPTAWSDDNRPTKGQTYDAGEQVGFPSQAIAPSHVHWEVRIEPIDSPATRGGNTLDPLQWVNGRSVTKAGAPSGDWWIWLLVLYAISRA